MKPLFKITIVDILVHEHPANETVPADKKTWSKTHQADAEVRRCTRSSPLIAFYTVTEKTHQVLMPYTAYGLDLNAKLFLSLTPAQTEATQHVLKVPETITKPDDCNLDAASPDKEQFTPPVIQEALDCNINPIVQPAPKDDAIATFTQNVQLREAFCSGLQIAE